MEKKDKYEIVAFALFLILSVWWVILFFGFDASLALPNLIWAATYQVGAIFGTVLGFIISYRWGGYRSVVGRAVLFLTIGLLFQIIGQSVFSVYGLFLNREIPYPSIADIGFFGSIPFYAIGVFELGKAAGARSIIKSSGGKLWSVILPVVMLFASYFFFLRHYEFDWAQPVRIVLDFGYPLGQAFYLSLALLVYFLSRKLLGGVMKTKVLIVLLALFVQYIAEFNFLYQFNKETWINGGYGDVLYMVAYFVMCFGLIQMGTIFEKIKKE